MTENLKIALSQLSESEANSNNNLACKGISKFQSCLKLKSRLSEGNVAEDFYYLGLNSLSHWPGEAQCNDSWGPKGLRLWQLQLALCLTPMRRDTAAHTSQAELEKELKMLKMFDKSNVTILKISRLWNYWYWYWDIDIQILRAILISSKYTLSATV